MNNNRKEYLRNYQKAFMKKRRDDWIEKNGPCAICGSQEDLEVDHIDRNTKERHPRDIWSRKISCREQELSKCQVLCASCHKEKTRKELSILNTGKKQIGIRTIKDTQLVEVKQLVEGGVTETSACKAVGISRKSYYRFKKNNFDPSNRAEIRKGVRCAG